MRGSVVVRGKSVSLVVYQGVDPVTKKKRYQWIPCKDRKQAEALRAVIATHPAYGSGVGPRGSSRLRLGDFLDDWLRTTVKLRCREKEARAREIIVRRHLKPALGHVPLAKVSPATVEGMLGRLVDVDPSRIFRVLRTALAQAVRLDLILQNPCDQIDPPKTREYRPRVWTAEEADRFLGVARGGRNHALYLVLMSTGLRPGGEVLGLCWRDVDLERGLIATGRALERPEGGGYRFTDLKTKTARRAIRIPAVVVAELRRLKAQVAAQKLYHGAAYHDLDLVFCQPNGRPLHWHNISKRDFKALCRRAKVPVIRPYDLRHWHATVLASEGVSIKAIQERMGHSTPAFTLARYTHAVPDIQGQAAEVIGRRLFGGKP